MAHEARFVRTRSRRHPWRWLGMLVLGSAFLASGMLGASQAAEPWAVTVTGLTGSADDLSLDGLTYDDATTALEQAAADGTPVTLPVAPLAFAGLTSTGATLDTQASTRTLTVGGPVKLLGVDADILVVAAWDSATDDSPSVTVAFRQDDISLTDLAPSLDAVDVGLSSAWTAFRRDTTDSSDVVVDDLPAAGQAFFDDGDASTVDDLAVGSGVAFRGAVTPGTPGLGQALTRLGINSARLDGTLSTSTEALEEGAPAPTGFSLTATIGVTSPASMPEWLELGSPWSLGLATDGAGTLTATLTGGATLTLGDTAIPSTAEVSVTRAPGGALSVDLTLDVDEVEAPFGATWLTLNSASLTASISADSVSGSVEASVTVDKGGDDELTGRVAITLARSAGATSATVDADLTGSISAQDLATLVGADLDGLPDGAPDFSLSDLSLHVGVDGSTTPKEISVSATGTAQVDFGDSTLGARVLVSSGQGGLLIAARPSDEVHLSDLLGSTSPDPVLPDIAVVISDHDLEAAASDLDGPTRAYFAKALCDSADQDCDFDLTIDTGVGIEANIQLPDQLTDALGEIGLETEDALRVSGHIPAFGGTKTELVVQLPGLAAAGDGQYVRGAGLDLFIRKQGAAVTFGLDGHLTLGIPRLESDDCPSGLYVGSGNSRTCIDEVRFSLAAQISFDTTSTSFELVGGLASKSDQGWQQPFGIPYLTIHEAKLKLGVTTGGTSAGSVSLGFLGRMNIGDKDISISALAGVRAEAPWIDFKGFTGSSKSGVSLRDLAKLHQAVSGDAIDLSIIPPVGVRNLFLSVGVVDDADLCLRSGFYMSGDLYLDRGLTGSQAQTPGCLPPVGVDADVTETCEADSDCLASVLVDIQTGKGGGLPSINAAGYVAGWNAGPLTFDPTRVKFSLNKAGARVFIQAGAKLLDPIVYATDPSTTATWASGNVKLDVSTQKLYVQGNLDIAPPSGLGVTMTGAGSFNLDDPDFVLELYLRAAFLDDIADGIDEAMLAVDQTADQFASVFSSSNMETVFKEIRTAFNELNSPTSPAWTTLSSGYFDFRDKIDEVNNYLSDFGLGRPIPVNQILDMTLHGIVTPDIPAVEVCIIRCVTIIPSINIPDIPGMCSYTPVLRDTAICTRGNGADKLRSQFAVPAVKDAVEDAGVEVPSGVTVAKLVSTFAQLEPTTPPAGARTLAATSGTRIDCAVSQVSYPASTIGDTFFDVNTMGTTVTVQGDSPGELGKDGEASTATVDDAQQGTLDALLTTSADGGCGDTVPSNEPAKTLTLALDKSVVTEASSLTATGTATNGHAGDLVTLDWGDGSSSTVEVANDLTWRGTHTYADDAGPGTSTTYLVEASADGYDGASRSVAVVNVVPLVVDLSATPTSVGETELATLTGRITDPGSRDTHTVTVDWGDGTAAEDVTVTNRAFTATHRYADDNPSGTASDAVTISVGVVDKDGGSSEATTSQTVVNRDPGEVTLGFPAALVDGENTFTRTGATETLTGTVKDTSVVDTLRAAINWGDGMTATLTLANDGTTTRRISSGHAWEKACLYQVAVDVTDDDLGSATTVRRWVVVTRATPGKAGGTGWWTNEMKSLAAGRPADITTADASCYLAIARHVSSTFGEAVPLATTGQAFDVLKPGGGGGAKLAAEREKLDRELLAALLDFAHGRVAWDTPVATGTDVGKVTFGRLVKLADQARAGTSVDRVMTLRQALGAV